MHRLHRFPDNSYLIRGRQTNEVQMCCIRAQLDFYFKLSSPVRLIRVQWTCGRSLLDPLSHKRVWKRRRRYGTAAKQNSSKTNKKVPALNGILEFCAARLPSYVPWHFWLGPHEHAQNHVDTRVLLDVRRRSTLSVTGAGTQVPRVTRKRTYKSTPKLNLTFTYIDARVPAPVRALKSTSVVTRAFRDGPRP